MSELLKWSEKNTVYKEQLKRQRLFSRQMRRLGMDLTAVFNYLMHGYKDRVKFFPNEHSKRTRCNSPTARREVLIR